MTLRGVDQFLKMKLKIFLILLVVTGLSVLFFIYKKNSGFKNPLPIPSFLPFTQNSLPKITNLYQGKLNTQIDIAENIFPKQRDISLLDVKIKKLSDQEFHKIAENLGFKNDPQIEEDTFDGKTLIWSSNEASLVIYPDIGRVSYSLNKFSSLAASKNYDQDFLFEKAQTFVSEKLNLENEELRLSSVSKNQKYYQVNLTPANLDLDILTLSPQNTPISVLLTPGGKILGAEINIFASISLGQELYKTRDFKNFLGSLDKAILIGFENENFDVSSLPKNSIRKTNIYSAQLFYLMDSSKSAVYHPYYRLKARVELTGEKEELESFLYLPAIFSY